jgi:heterodisulfide reductase subunit A
MRPLESNVDGIFLAGTCHGPRDIVESVVEGTGAASLAVGILSKDELELPVVVAKVNTDKCTGCMKCEVACPYGAIAPENGKASVNEGMCKGCGSCASACYQAAITLQDWSRDQLLRQVSALVRES